LLLFCLPGVETSSRTETNYKKISDYLKVSKLCHAKFEGNGRKADQVYNHTSAALPWVFRVVTLSPLLSSFFLLTILPAQQLILILITAVLYSAPSR